MVQPSNAVGKLISMKSDAAVEDPATPHKKRRSGGRRRTRRAVLSILTGLLLWEFSIPIFDINGLVLSPPTKIFGRFIELLADGSIQKHIYTSFSQFALGYIFCALTAIPLGLAMGKIERLRDFLDPWISALYATPTISLAPLILIWLGLGLQAKAVIVALMAFFPMVINTVAGVDSVTKQYEEIALAFRASRLEQFVKLVFPGALPFIFAGLRLAIGRGIVGVVVADLFGATQGLGYLLIQASQLFNTVDVFVVTVILAGMGVLLTLLLGVFQRLLCGWQSGT